MGAPPGTTRDPRGGGGGVEGEWRSSPSVLLLNTEPPASASPDCRPSGGIWVTECPASLDPRSENSFLPERLDGHPHVTEKHTEVLELGFGFFILSLLS